MNNFRRPAAVARSSYNHVESMSIKMSVGVVELRVTRYIEQHVTQATSVQLQQHLLYTTRCHRRVRNVCFRGKGYTQGMDCYIGLHAQGLV